jgi:hypothetical protein
MIFSALQRGSTVLCREGKRILWCSEAERCVCVYPLFVFGLRPIVVGIALHKTPG